MRSISKITLATPEPDTFPPGAPPPPLSSSPGQSRPPNLRGWSAGVPSTTTSQSLYNNYLFRIEIYLKASKLQTKKTAFVTNNDNNVKQRFVIVCALCVHRNVQSRNLQSNER